MIHFTYILYSRNKDKYYIGSTSNSLENRIEKHLSNHSSFTFKAKDWEIVYYEEYKDVSSARKRELQIKYWKSEKLIQYLIETKA